MYSLLVAALCTFLPPTGWEMAQLKKPSAHIQIGFLGKGTTTFRPSLSLAVEEVDVSLKEYIKAVKEIYKDDPKAQWRDLGKFQTQAGEGRLTELANNSAWGEMKVLQAIVVAEKKAYILTAAVLKKEFPQFQEEILQAFRSLNVVADLWTAVSDPEKRGALQQLFAHLGQSGDQKADKQRLQQAVDACSELGPYWQFLALREGLAKIQGNL